MAYDGTITVGTKLVTDKFDKQINKLENKIKQEEKKSELKLKAKLESEEALQKQNQELEKISKKYEEVNGKVERFNYLNKKISENKGTYSQFQERMDLKSEISDYDSLKKQMEQAQAKQQKLQTTVQKTSMDYETITNNLKEYKANLESIKVQKQQAQIKNIKDDIGKVNNSLGQGIKKIGRMALGAFSLASAYGLVVRASSQLKQYDQQYATNIDYINYLLSQLLAPALNNLVNLAGKLMGYLNYIANAWFGITLFSKNSAKNFAKIQNSTSKMKKDLQTTPFDEMNVLTESGTISSGTGIKMPSISPEDLGGEIPEWIQWIANNKDLIIGAITGIASALALLKLGKLASELNLVNIETVKFIGKISGVLLIVYGVIQLFKDFSSYLEKFNSDLANNGTSFEDLGKIITDVGLIVLGLGLVFGNLPLIITGAVISIVGIIVKNWNKIKSGIKTAIEWLKNLQDNFVQLFIDNIENIKKNFGYLGVGIVSTFVAAFNWIVEIVKGAIELITDIIDGLFTGFKDVFDGIIMICKGNFKQGLISILKGIVNIIIGILNGLISGINAIIYPIRAMIAGLGNVMGKSWKIDTVKIPKIPFLETGAIINAPGRGIPVAGGRAIAGERGAEGILPLTNSQAMETLGETIGKYITINANIVNSMNGRVISRQLQQIQNENNFAYNA